MSGVGCAQAIHGCGFACHIPTQRGRQLLIVDDSEFDLGAGVAVAESMGWGDGNLRTAMTVADAIEAVWRAPHPDLAIVDYHLGVGETGLPVIAALRESSPRAVIAVFTGVGQDSDVASIAISAGANLVVSKRLDTRNGIWTISALLAVLGIACG